MATPEAHREAGEDHLKAAQHMAEAGKRGEAKKHLEIAAKHAAAAGSAWDKDKHPRDEAGRFT